MSSRPPSSYRTLASFSRIKLLYFLQQRGTMTVSDLSEATGLHHNTTREHLQRLISDGFVTCEPEERDVKGRPRILYSAAAGVDHYAGSIRVAKVEAAERRGDQVRRMLPLTAAIDSPLQRQLDALDDHLDQTGFEARIDADGRHLTLHECPYSEMVKDHPEVCRVHLGLVQGILQQAGGPLTADALHPLTEPDTCTLDLNWSHQGAECEEIEGDDGAQQSVDVEVGTDDVPSGLRAVIFHGVFRL
ncbi:ArsR family transcriptional regulator [Cryobacterium sp. GrIS_2_6]|uniref:helix-turn-helix transcriptional regulator n=1 Tax=Cryobacterium sp. GrIS_2_6 TaxID=3162785 RepID=UPI002E0425B7|nr:ArsR family transcriptional regulator [Cryobacterium psychrotolerans]MEC5152490.1 putative ArsR family transcriptional regulator [Cryobacterium psychrotolerans]